MDWSMAIAWLFAGRPMAGRGVMGWALESGREPAVRLALALLVIAMLVLALEADEVLRALDAASARRWLLPGLARW